MTIEVDFSSRLDEKYAPPSASHTRSSSLTSFGVDGLPSSTASSSSTVSLSSIAAVCRQRADQYETAVINDVLHLSYQGYSVIQTAVFASFTTLSTLYLDHNKLTAASLTALSSAPLLTALFLHSNHITSLASLPALSQLRTLNVSENALTDLHGVEQLSALVTLDASHNAVAAVQPLHSLSQLRDLLLSHNCLPASPSPIPILAALPALRVLQLHHNPIVAQQAAYRRTLLSQLPSVQWLDERGVREDERVGVEGWKESGLQGERAARGKLQEERREKEERQWQQWKDSRAAHRALQEKRVSYSSLKHAINDHDDSDSSEGQADKAKLDEAISLSLSDASLTAAGQQTELLVSPALPATAVDESSDYHVMRSLSIDQYYQSVQQSVPSTLHLLSDSDDDDDEHEDSSVPSSAVPFLLGITPALSVTASQHEYDGPTLPSPTASPPSSSPSSSLPLSLSSSPPSHSREPSQLMAAFVLSQSQSSEEKEQPADSQPDCRLQVGRVLAMLSEESAAAASSGRRVRETNVSEEDSEGEDEDEDEEVRWVSYGVDSSSDDEKDGFSSRSRPTRR